PRLYRTIGTVPNARAIAVRYSGWYTQVAEFAQMIAKSNAAADLNLFAISYDGTSWRGSEDAAAALGFIGSNALATGSATGPTAAVLTSANVERFALRPNLMLAVTADERVPVVVRFRDGDFVNVTTAT